MQVEIGSIAEFMKSNYFPFQIENRYAGPIECHPSMLLLAFELEKNRRRHVDAAPGYLTRTMLGKLVILDPTRQDRQDTSQEKEISRAILFFP